MRFLEKVYLHLYIYAAVRQKNAYYDAINKAIFSDLFFKNGFAGYFCPLRYDIIEIEDKIRRSNYEIRRWNNETGNYTLRIKHP